MIGDLIIGDTAMELQTQRAIEYPALGLKVLISVRQPSVPLCFDHGQAVTFLIDDLHAAWCGQAGGGLSCCDSKHLQEKKR